MPVAQAMVLDVVKDFKQRPKYIGYCGSMLGVAFTVGPGIGAGITAATDFRTTFYVTSGICGAITLWAFTSIVETSPVSAKGKGGSGGSAALPKESERWGAVVWGPAFAIFCLAYGFFVMCR